MELSPARSSDLPLQPRLEAASEHRSPGVLIVGGGLAGAALAYHVLQRSSQLQVTLLEPGPHVGCGIAYGARSPLLRLNVPAARMSLDPEQPLDFVRFAGAEADPDAFLPRALYGQYVSERLRSAARLRPDQLRVLGSVALRVCTGPVAVSGSGQRRLVQLDGGRTLAADTVVLATGLSARSGGATLPQDERIIDAWDEPALSRIPLGARVLLLGTGLSALDAVQLLERRKLLLLSRHALLPRAHAARTGSFQIPEERLPVPSRLRSLLRWMRRLCADAMAAGVPWQHALDAVRPHTPHIWQQLTAADQQRFLRLVRPYWEVLRHRAAPDILARVAAASAAGQLQLEAGRLLACCAEPTGLRVSIRSRGGQLREQRFDAIVKCLGPSLDPREASPLLAALIRDGEAQVCRSGIGIATGPLGRVIDATGRAHEDLFALGVLCRASRWETTSAPDIVREAAALAAWLCTRASEVPRRGCENEAQSA